jgi:MGT family glycosyltransferase
MEAQRVLFVIEPGMGHFHPLVPIMRTLEQRGHAVALATSALYQARAEGVGIPFYPLGPHYSEERMEEFYPWTARLRNHYLRVSYDFLRIFMGSIPQRIPALQRIADAFCPTVVIAGPTAFAAQLFCEQRAPQLPWAVLCPTTHFMSPRLDAPPAGIRRPRAGSHVQQRLYAGLLLVAKMMLAPWRSALNRYRRQLGLRPHTDPLSPAVMAPYLLIHLCSREFDYNRHDLPPQVHYVGPSLWDGPASSAVPAWLNQLPRDPPLVYATLGTVFNKRRAVFETLIRALGELNVQGVVATGPGCDPCVFAPAPPNVRVESYIPQSLLGARPQAIITHGGFNTVLSALSQGLPLVCLPQGADQPDNAQRCVEAGAGVRINSRWVTVARVKAAVTAVLSHESYRFHARRLQRTLLAHDGPTEAADLILQLATTAAPVYDRKRWIEEGVLLRRASGGAERR